VVQHSDVSILIGPPTSQQAPPAKVIVFGGAELRARTQQFVEPMNIRQHCTANGHTRAERETFTGVSPSHAHRLKRLIALKNYGGRKPRFRDRHRRYGAKHYANPWFIDERSGHYPQPMRRYSAVVVGYRYEGRRGGVDS